MVARLEALQVNGPAIHWTTRSRFWGVRPAMFFGTRRETSRSAKNVRLVTTSWTLTTLLQQTAAPQRA